MPAISLTSVVFPAPLAPISATCSPGETCEVDVVQHGVPGHVARGRAPATVTDASRGRRGCRRLGAAAGRSTTPTRRASPAAAGLGVVDQASAVLIGLNRLWK